MSVSASLVLLLAWRAAASDVGVSASFNGRDELRFQAGPGLGLLFTSAESAPIADDWDTVLFQGASAAAGLEYEIARKAPNGAWTSWYSAPVKTFPNGRFWGKASLPAGAGSLRLRAAHRGAQVRHDVTIYSVDVFLSSDKEASPPGAPARELAQPFVHGRAAWSAAEPREAYTEHTPTLMTLHHTAGKMTSTLEESKAELLFIQDFHQNGRGWNDIAYHYLIDAAGNIFQGRPENVVGAHTFQHNTGNVGICLLGNFHPPRNDAPPAPALDAVVILARDVAARRGIDPATFKGHRNLRSTDCPGDSLYALMGALRRRIAATAAAASAGIAPLRRKLLSAPRWDNR